MPGTLRAYVWPLPNASLSECSPQRESKEKLNTARMEQGGIPGGKGRGKEGERWRGR